MKKYIILLLVFLTACDTSPALLATPAAENNTIYVNGDNQVIDNLVVTGSTTYDGLHITGNYNVINLPVISGTRQNCVYVSGNYNTIIGLDCSNVLSGTGPDADQNGITDFGTGNKFIDVNIHNFTCSGSNHCDGIQTWNGGASEPVAMETEITGVIDLPGQSSGALNKCVQTQDGSSGWNIHNLLCIASLGGDFINSTNIRITNSTFIGSGVDQPQGIKFGSSSGVVENNIFEGFTAPGGSFFPVSYPDANLVSDNNCYFNDAPRPIDAGDVFGDPLFTSDYHLQAGSPCLGKGAFPDIPATVTPISTETLSFTPTKSQTATYTVTASPHPRATKTPIPSKTISPVPSFTPTLTPTGIIGCEVSTSQSYVITVCRK